MAFANRSENGLHIMCVALACTVARSESSIRMQSRRTHHREEGENVAALPSGANGEVPSTGGGPDRRAYFRVTGLLPIRVSPLSEEDVATEIFDLSLPDPLIQPLDEVDEDAPLAARLRRIEEKLDLLLGASQVQAPKQLSGRDRQSVVFSGAGLCLDVRHTFRERDPYKVEILLPPPYSRVVRAVARCVEDSSPRDEGAESRPMALALDHMEPDERDALVAYSYDLQRFALRARQGPAIGPAL